MWFTFILAILFEIGFPIALATWFTRRYGVRWKFIWIGALVFIASQVGHIPALAGLTALFQNPRVPTPPEAMRPIFNAVVLGLMAGLFEETARVVAFWLLRGQARAWKPAVALGIGHGGIESILFAGLPVLVSYVTMLVARFAPASIPGGLSPDLQIQLASFAKTSWDLPLAGAFERLFAITLQITLTVMVLQAFTRRNALWYVAAVGWHALVDGVAVYTAPHLGVWPLEGLVGWMALVSLGFLLWIIRRERSAGGLNAALADRSAGAAIGAGDTPTGGENG